MNSEEIGWHFPSNGGGTESGFNDSGIATFGGKPFQNLAREIIQNSMDARADPKKPVTVSFEVEEMPTKDFPGRDAMLEIIKKCASEYKGKGDDKAEKFFQRAKTILKKETIICLKIQDYNTTGLRDGATGKKSGEWHHLVKMTGSSDKKDDNAGGSHGVGKSAPFVVSSLHTVFYSTRYTDTKSKEEIERAQGKAILISHKIDKDEYSQGVGFYGIKKGCNRLEGDTIPTILQRKGATGTTLLIPGLVERENWKERIIAAVISNYFYAIHHKDLEVLIDHELVLIDCETLPKFFEDPGIINADKEQVEAAHSYYRSICQDEEASEERVLNVLGHCKLWLLIKEGFEQKVAILRRGIKITDKQDGLIRWPACADFAAVFVCDNKDGNQLLRQMENPAHNAFEPSRLDNPEYQKKGAKALKELAKWVREVIKTKTSGQTEKITPLSKMSRFFPAPDEGFDGKSTEKDFDGSSSISMKPVVKSNPKALQDADDDGDGTGDDAGNQGNGGKGSGKGSGRGSGRGSGGNSGGTATADIQLPFKALRILSDANDSNAKNIKFTPIEDCAGAKISVRIAGDSFSEVREIDKASIAGRDVVVENGNVITDVKAGERLNLAVWLKSPETSTNLNVALLVNLTKKAKVPS